MKEFVKSFSSLTLGMSVFSLQLLGDMLTPTEPGEHKDPATRALDAVTNATVDQFGSTLRATFFAADNVQRGITAIAFNLFWPFGRYDRNRLARESDSHFYEHRSPADDDREHVGASMHPPSRAGRGGKAAGRTNVPKITIHRLR